MKQMSSTIIDLRVDHHSMHHSRNTVMTQPVRVTNKAISVPVDIAAIKGGEIHDRRAFHPSHVPDRPMSCDLTAGLLTQTRSIN